MSYIILNSSKLSFYENKIQGIKFTLFSFNLLARFFNNNIDAVAAQEIRLIK